MRNVLVIIFCMMLISSCSTTFDEPAAVTTEVINGFTVKWRSQITERQKSIIRDILENMILVEGDYFVMGATPEQEEYARPNEYPNSYNYLTDYYIGKYEVTDEQFNIITNSSKSASSTSASRISYAEWLNFLCLLKDLSSISFTFPTESQWEFAARGGKYSKMYVYPGSNDINEIRSTSHINGSNVPNELGIYNMGDLKSEWCADFYDNLISGKLLINWVQNEGKYHVVRGGNSLCTIETIKYSNPPNNSIIYYCLGHEASFINPEMDYRNCRLSSRSYAYESNNHVGCRLVVNIK